MTSKEALNYLTSKVFTGGNGILEIEAEECKKTILNDLERLEELEEKYYDLEDELSDTHYKMVRYKKVIEILKMQTSIENIKCENGNIYIVDIGDISVLITQQEYELLKEVLEND